ncbi:MAG: urea amidolyase [Paracoccaceae bacterium]|nr:urea amidolyase [Paracoccaceae bacterium]
MTRSVIVHKPGPGVTMQDTGRPGFLAYGLSRGGAADRLALAEGAALLRQDEALPAIEMAGYGGTFAFTTPTRIALTGAPMRCTLDGEPLAWNASHAVAPGQLLEIGGVQAGVYGYLSIGGGIAVPPRLGGSGAHLAAGLGAVLTDGANLPLAPDSKSETGLCLTPTSRLDGGTLRILPSLQTDVFPPETRERFTYTEFTRDARGNRMGVRLVPPEEGFGLTEGQTILSEVIVTGDIQIPGDGAPYILLSECQTTGGYPRIGTVIPADLPKVAQTPPGAKLRFEFVTREAALQAETHYRKHLTGLRSQVRPRLRDPYDMPDLGAYTLISGAITGEE